MARICITGEWHQAIVVAACLADMGHRVTGAVSTAAAADRLNAGTPPVHEPGLPELLASGSAAGRLAFTPSLDAALDGAEYVFIAIDTPIDDHDVPDLGTVMETARRIGDALQDDILLVVTAQVPVGTCAQLRAIVAERSGREVGVVHVPEFLRLGTALHTFMEADRFIVGADDDAAAERVAELYRPLGRPMLRMGLRSAEMAKHASNAFLALSISFANEVADLCEAVGADVSAVTAGMKLDARIGPHAFLSAGLGFAGGTLGRDLRALQAIGREHARETAVVDAVLQVNASRAGLVMRNLVQAYGAVEGLRIAVLGLTYKPGTSTMRRSIALDVIRDLVAGGAEVVAFDPLARLDDADALPPFQRAGDAIAAARGADAAVLITEWADMDRLDLAGLRAAMRRPLFIDTRNRLDPAVMAATGFTYVGVGVGSRAAPRVPVAEPVS